MFESARLSRHVVSIASPCGGKRAFFRANRVRIQPRQAEIPRDRDTIPSSRDAIAFRCNHDPGVPRCDLTKPRLNSGWPSVFPCEPSSVPIETSRDLTELSSHFCSAQFPSNRTEPASRGAGRCSGAPAPVSRLAKIDFRRGIAFSRQAEPTSGLAQMDFRQRESASGEAEPASNSNGGRNFFASPASN